MIFDFAIINKEAIVEELEGYAGKCVLDLTQTALFSLLAQWGEEYAELTAYCDEVVKEWQQN